MNTALSHHSLRTLSIVLLFVVSLNVLAAGYSFITNPSGEGLGLTTAYLRPSAPFKNFLVPGLVLFTVIGIGCAVVAFLAIAKKGHYPLWVLVQGCILAGWIAIQVTMVASIHFLHFLIAAIALLLILLGWKLRKRRLI